MTTFDWASAATQFLVGIHPKSHEPWNRIVIEAVQQPDGRPDLWAVRWSSSALARHPSFTHPEFLIESDFRGDELPLIRFQSKEDAWLAFVEWRDHQEVAP